MRRMVKVIPLVGDTNDDDDDDDDAKLCVTVL